MKNYFIYIVATGLLASCGSNNQNENKNSDTVDRVTSNDTNIVKKTPGKMKEEDQQTFFTNAAIGGLMEVEASSRLIKNNTGDDKIISHAKMIRDDHTKINEELKKLALAQRVEIPSVLPAKKQAQLKEMESLRKEAQNETYLNLMLSEHLEAIDLFNLAKSMDDKKIVDFATKTLPMLTHHYEMTVALKAAFIKSKENQGDDLVKISNKRKDNPAKNQN